MTFFVLLWYNILYNFNCFEKGEKWSDIPTEKVRKRYDESINNLEKVIPLCDFVSVFDNSESFRRLATIKEGKLIQKADKVPFWFNSKLKNLISSGKVKTDASVESRKNKKIRN